MRQRLLFVLPLLLFVGCAKDPSAEIIGKWKVDPDFVKQVDSGSNPGFMTGFAATFTYEFKADKTFAALMTSGTYTMNGPNLSIVTTKLGNQDLSKMGGGGSQATMTGVLSADGNSLTLQLPPATQAMLPAGLKQGVKMVRDK